MPRSLFTLEVGLLCAFTALLHAKPSEPHLVPYLLQRGFTEVEVDNQIFPVYTYSDAFFVLLAAPLSALFGAKACVVAGAVCRLATRALLLYGTTLASQQLMQVFYGAGVASMALFDAYTLRLVGANHYTGAASLTSAAATIGYLIAAEGGQLAVDRGAPLRSLFFASALTVGAATALSFALPAEATPSKPIAFHPDASALRAFAAAVRGCYSTPPLRLLSACAVCLSLLQSIVESYGTNLFVLLRPEHEVNGHVAAASRLAAVAAALCAARFRVVLIDVAGSRAFAVCLAAAGGCAGAAASATSPLFAYCCYVAAVAALTLGGVLASAQLAAALDDSLDASAAGDERCKQRTREEVSSHPSPSLPLPLSPSPLPPRPPPPLAVLFGCNAAMSLVLQAAGNVAASILSASSRDRFVAAALIGAASAAGVTLCAAAERRRTGAWALVRSKEGCGDARAADDDATAADKGAVESEETVALISPQMPPSGGV